MHVILEQAPPKRAANSNDKFTNLHISSPLRTQAISSEKTCYLFVFSAADETAAKAQIALLFRYVKQRNEVIYRSLYKRLVYTLQRRTHLQWRSAVVVNSHIELLETMEENKMRPVRTGRPPRLGFVFTGQGAQWYVCHKKIIFICGVSPVCRYGMGRELRQLYPVFEKAILKADLILNSIGCPWSLHGELLLEFYSKANC